MIGIDKDRLNESRRGEYIYDDQRNGGPMWDDQSQYPLL